MRFSLISWSFSNKHLSQNSLSSANQRSKTPLFLLHRAHLFIFLRLYALNIWVTWKMDAATPGWITNRDQRLLCERSRTRITSQGERKIIVLIDRFLDIDR